MTDQPEWIKRVNKAACFARHDALEQLRKIVTKKMEWEEEYLKKEYGKGWTVMIRCQAGRGYEICQEILNAINEIEEKDGTIAGPITIYNEVIIEPTKSKSYLRAALEAQAVSICQNQQTADEFSKALREVPKKDDKT